MRSDDSTGKRRDDISADELLAQLKKSVEKQTTQSAREKTVKANVPAAPALKIDDEVYDDAKRGLLSENDDSDVDIDALINKFIRTPAKKPETDLTEDIVREVSRPDEDDDVKLFEPDRKDSEPVQPEPVNTEEVEEEEKEEIDSEPIPEQDDLLADNDTVSVSEPENPVAEDAGGAWSDNDSTPPDSTAVFDVQKVREASEDSDRKSDTALENAATEVFSAVHAEDAADNEAGGSDGGKEKTYGKPEADEIDQTDLNLMIAFGMNDELKDKVDAEKVSEIEKKNEETMQIQNVGSRYEYTDRAQNSDILTRFKSDYYWGIARIALAVVMFIAVFWVENCGLFGRMLPNFMRPEAYPIVYAMIDLQFVVICGALAGRQIIDGVKNMIKLKPTIESLTAFVIILSVLYTVISCFIAPRSGFALYNLPVVGAIVLALIYEFMNLKRSVFGFNVISSKRRKFVISPVSDATESLEREIFSDYVPADSKIIRVAKTDFVDGFFSKIEGEQLPKPIIGIMIPVILIIAAVFFFLTFFRTESAYMSLTMAFLSVMATLPLSAFIVYSLPYYRAAKRAYDADSAIIGESAFSDYAGSAVISFEDKEVFPSNGVKVTSIKVYGNNRIDEIIYNLASAFITVRGPLADVFSQATHDLGHSENVVLEEVDDDGFTVTIDDVSVSIGKGSYMEKMDFEPPYDPEDKRIEAASIGILYIAYQGELAAKVYVQYTIDSEFEKILAQLYKTGMCVGIKSFDPNIDDMLLAKKLKAMKYPVKVIRSKTVEDIPHTSPRCVSSIVSKRSVKELLRTVASCERVSSAIRTSFIFKILAMLLGVVVMVFVLFFNAEPFVRSIYAVGYQLIWIALVTLVTRFSV